MIIIEINEGPKIPYEVNGTKITFDDDLMLNLAKRQSEEPVHIDICYNKARQLITGTQDAWAFVAQIDIPAIEYSEGEEPEPLPLDMDKVTLTLWALV
jgi:hypothetical protein